MNAPYQPTPQQIALVDRLAELVVEIQAGGEEAATELIKAIERPLRAILRTRARVNDAELDDLYQDTVIMVLQFIRSGEVRDPRAILAIVRQIAVRRAGRYHKTDGRYLPLDEAVAEVRPDTRESMQSEHSAQVSEHAKLIQAALARLPDLDRDILHRFYLLEQDEETICSELGLTLHQMQVRKTRALQDFGLHGKAVLAGSSWQKLAALKRKFTRREVA